MHIISNEGKWKRDHQLSLADIAMITLFLTVLLTCFDFLIEHNLSTVKILILDIFQKLLMDDVLDFL